MSLRCPKDGLNVSPDFIRCLWTIPLPTSLHTTSGSLSHPPVCCRRERLHTHFASNEVYFQCHLQRLQAAFLGYFRSAGHKGLVSWGQARNYNNYNNCHFMWHDKFRVLTPMHNQMTLIQCL